MINNENEVLNQNRVVYPQCDSGIFRLHFTSGSGMEDPTDSIHDARRAVVCQVFHDVSDFINTPLKTNGLNNKVEIWIRSFNDIYSPNGTLAMATSFNVFPLSTPTNPTVINGGIIDSEIWKTIHTGLDSYAGVISPPFVTGNGSGLFYHGMVAINFSNSWNLDLNNVYPSNHDLYTVVLHEVMHALGLISEIKEDGSSNISTFGDEYFTRYDSFLLNANNQNLITTANSCPMYDNDFTAQINDIHPNNPSSPCNSEITQCTSVVKFNGTNIINLPVFTPECFANGSSLSHFEDSCVAGQTNNQYFVMSNAVATGVVKRYPKEEERKTLCDIGYNVSNVYGSSIANNLHSYSSSSCNGITVAGVNDGLDYSSDTYLYFSNENTNFNLNNPTTSIFNNDINATGFEGLMDVYNSNSQFNGVTGAISGSINATPINFLSQDVGLHLLRYVPLNGTERGNITYVFIYITSPIVNCSTPDFCNLILNGDFEDIHTPVTTAGQINNACNINRGNAQTPELYHQGALNAGYQVPTFTTVPNMIQVSDMITGNFAFGGMYMSLSTITQNVTSEPICFQITSPLIPNTDYKLTFFTFPKFQNVRNIFRFQALLTNTQFFSTPDTYGDPQFIFNATNYAGIQQVWQKNEIIFNSSTIQHNFIHLGAFNNAEFQIINSFGNNSQYYFIDNVSLIPVPNDALNLPPQICQTNNIPNLSDFLGAIPNDGEFTGDGVALTDGVYSFNPTGFANGSFVEISYTYHSTNGCGPVTVNDTILITNSCALPFISQVYCNTEENSFIEIKNSSTTEGISAGSYFLSFYDQSTPTSSTPTSSINIGAFAPNEVKVFYTSLASNPSYAVNINNTILPANFTFDGYRDILTISTTNNALSYNNRTDLIGDQDMPWCEKASLVRSGCATMVPRIDVFDMEDWSRFELDEINTTFTEFSNTNPVLGRHFQEALHFDIHNWHDVPVNFNSIPDRSRVAQINTSFNTEETGSFECCSLNVLSTVIINENQFVSIENTLDVQDSGVLNIQNNGSLVMIKDTFHDVANSDLINTHNHGEIHISKTTVGLDAYTDYVYWGTPLANIPQNDYKNTADNLFPSPTFDSSRFYGFENANYQDIPNWYNGAPSSASYANGYDDNLDDYFILTPLQRNQQLIAGLGYVTWPPSGCIGLGCNYTKTFSGKPNNGVVTVPVFHNEPSNSFANLVSNPYPSAINLDKFFELNAGVIDPVAYIWGRTPQTLDNPDPSNPGPYQLSYSEDNFLIYNPTMMILPNSFGNQIFDDPDDDDVSNSDNLSSCQSFFVQTVANNPDFDYDATLTFNNSLRTKEENNTFARNSLTTEKGENKLWLDLKTDNNKSSQIGIAFLENATDSYSSKEDVRAISGKKLNFYTKTTEHDLIIDAQSKFNNNKIIPIGITSLKENKNYSISINRVDGELKNETIYLEDRLLNTILNISQKPYKFNIENPITDDRFILRFNNKKSNNETNSKNEVDITYNEKGVEVLSKSKIIKSITIIDIYLSALSGIEIKKIDAIHSKTQTILLDKKYPIINIIVSFEDGSYITKKMML